MRLINQLPIKVSLFLLILGLTSCKYINGGGGHIPLPPSHYTRIPIPVENTGSGCNSPTLPNFANLDSIPYMPDPFQSLDGTHINHIRQWRCRRAEIGAMAQHYELGKKPHTTSKDVIGTLDGDTLNVKINQNGKTISFNSVIHYPSGGKPPYPAMIGMPFSFLNNSDLDSLGVAIISFPSDQLAQEFGPKSRGKGTFFKLFPNEHNAGALIAWAWGVSRLIDALYSTHGTQINYHRLGVTGCSRWGKGALVAGAFDERIILTIPQESGSGGVAGWRISKAQFDKGVKVQTLQEIVNENVWFRKDFSKFRFHADKLPFDQHEIMGMVAPRALLAIENSSYDWLGVKSVYTTAVIAKKIWKAMGIPDRMGVAQMGHPHCQFPNAQRPVVNSFVKKFLLGEKGVDTKVVKTDADINPNLERWAPWKVPTLQ